MNKTCKHCIWPRSNPYGEVAQCLFFSQLGRKEQFWLVTNGTAILHGRECAKAVWGWVEGKVVVLRVTNFLHVPSYATQYTQIQSHWTIWIHSTPLYNLHKFNASNLDKPTAIGHSG